MRMQYYPILSGEMDTARRPWTSYDDDLVSLLFSKIANRTALTAENREALEKEIAGNLFDLCLFINKDAHHC